MSVTIELCVLIMYCSDFHMFFIDFECYNDGNYWNK